MIKYLLILFSVNSMAKDISMEEFLDQVKANNQAFKASELGKTGAMERQSEAALITLPQFNLSYQIGNDERNVQSPLYLTNGKILLASINQQTTFGLTASLGYSWNYKETSVPAGGTAVPTYYWSSPTLQINQSLWRNGFGSEVRAQKQLVESSSKSSFYQESFRNQMSLVEAKQAYQRLFYARKTVRALEESLDLANKLKTWSKNRVKTNLGDESDFLQTKSAYDLRALDLIKAQMDEKSAALYFNSLRNIDSEKVDEELLAPKVPEYKNDMNSTKKLSRDDVRAALEALKLSKANSQISKEKNKPALDVFATYSGYGLDFNKSSEAISDSTKFDSPGYTVGVKFSSPLAFWKSTDVRSGYEKDVLAADLYYRRKNLEQDRDYKDLKIKLENTSQRYDLAKVLEASQKSKLENERKRYQKGRTTLFQVLQFEQDYVNAQLNTIRTENEFNSLFNELKLYNEASEI